MKKIFVLLSVVMFLSFTMSAFARGNAKRNVYTSNQMNTGIGINQNISRPAKGNLMPTLVQTLPYEDLSDAETNSLIFMVAINKEMVPEQCLVTEQILNHKTAPASEHQILLTKSI